MGETPVENGRFSPSMFENGFKDTVLTAGKKEGRLLRTMKYMYSESIKRKDQTDGLESSLVLSSFITSNT